jgi:SAM-dependent methyltransferase
MSSNMEPHHLACPDCGSGRVSQVGAIPDGTIFAGNRLEQPLPGGFLWQCGACHLRFRWPSADKRTLDRLYAAGAERAWSDSAVERKDWRMARTWLRERLPASASVLDLGCFDGGFLHFLGDDYTRFGAEINPSARARARGKGIAIVANDFETLQPADGGLDCITAFDVIEHTHEPLRFLRRCRDLAKPGGRIVISTGNADALSFRLMGARYWYCRIPEHLAFISPRWFEIAADTLGLTIDGTLRFAHGKRTASAYLYQMLRSTAYRMAPRLYLSTGQHLLKQLNRVGVTKTHVGAPSWMAAKDHFIILCRKH